MNRLIREARNVLDGKYHIVEDKKDDEKSLKAGFREGESRVVRKLLDLGLALPQNNEAKPSKRR